MDSVKNQNETERESMIFYRSFYEAAKILPIEEKVKIYEMIFEYGFYFTEPKTEETTPLVLAFFGLVKPQIEKNITRYENGKKGGRPSTKKDGKKTKAKPKETKPEPNYNVNYNVNDNVNVIKKEIHKEKNTLSANADFGECVGLFNSVCVSLPKVRTITETRKEAITSALSNLQSIETYKDLSAAEVFKALFETVERSDFLTGRNGNGFQASFDWVLKKSNLVKIIEGNYNNRSQTSNNAEDEQSGFYDTAYYERLAAELERERNGK